MCYKWVESVFRHVCATHSVSKKKFLVIQMGWNVALFSRPVAAPPSDRKNRGVQPKIAIRGDLRDVTADSDIKSHLSYQIIPSARGSRLFGLGLVRLEI